MEQSQCEGNGNGSRGRGGGSGDSGGNTSRRWHNIHWDSLVQHCVSGLAMAAVGLGSASDMSGGGSGGGETAGIAVSVHALSDRAQNCRRLLKSLLRTVAAEVTRARSSLLPPVEATATAAMVAAGEYGDAAGPCGEEPLELPHPLELLLLPTIAICNALLLSSSPEEEEEKKKAIRAAVGALRLAEAVVVAASATKIS